MALSKVNFNSLNVTPAASKAIKFNSNNNGIETGDVGGSLVLISTTTASNASTTSITSGIDSTYKEYIIKFINYHTDSDNARPYFQASTNGGSSYGVTATSTAFRATNSEDDSHNELAYTASHDVAQSTSFFSLADIYMNDEADENMNGFIYLFDPSNTTFVKHFIGRFSGMNNAENVYGFGAGYFNTTSAVNAIQFKNSAGTHDGTFKLYGVS